MEINFSIPVDLFDYRESENSLYSYAKLKIFYIGMTGDKRLFTKSFSDQLLKSLPYVPVVGFYDEEEDDFKGHNPEIQNIYGIVPEDTEIEYIKEKGKEYAVCDVILYTGRTDKTGKIAQKIVGKQHSLELNPNDTTYQINRDEKGKLKNIEFKTGSLLGLSVLGDTERPAFAGSGFFNEDSRIVEIFEGLRAQMKEFSNNKKQRGEEMDLQETMVNQTPEPEQVAPEYTEKDIFEKFLNVFIKQTDQEKTDELMIALQENFGQEIYPVQWSIAEGVIVFYDFGKNAYLRTKFTVTEDGEITFDTPVAVRSRYLTDEEIAKTWPENGTDFTTETEEIPQDGVAALGEAATGIDQAIEATIMGTQELVDSQDSAQTDGETHVNEELQNTKEIEEASIALNTSERAELEAFRKERKEELIRSFEEDLSKDFIGDLLEKVNDYSFDELDIILSKEFTRNSRKENKSQKQNAFVYVGETTPTPKTRKEELESLVSKYKTKK